MKLIAIAILLFVTPTLSGQDSTRILIAAGQKVSDVITTSVMYQYKEFTPGRILFKDDTSMDARLNYNLFNGEIMFVSAADTLAISRNQMINIRRVTIDSHTYIYNKGYMEVIRQNNGGSLVKKQRYYVVSREKIGGYDFASPGGSIDSYDSFSDRANNRHDLVVRENISLQLNTQYLIGDPYRLFLPVSRKNFEKIFFKKRNEIASYLNEHVVDFRNEKHISSLFSFLTDL